MKETKKAKDAEEARNIEEKYKDASHGKIQWKGTGVCMDVYCKCGFHSHVDDDFVYYLVCPKCDTKYYCNAHIELIEIDKIEDKFYDTLVKQNYDEDYRMEKLIDEAIGK